MPLRVVYDTVVFVQALISGRGPSAACLELARSGEVLLLLSNATLAELEDVPLRPSLTSRYPHLTPQRTRAFIASVQSLAAILPTPPRAIALPRDPDDEPLIDLAVAGGASHLVTWNDRHLTYLMRADRPEAHAFRSRFPSLRIVSPVDFLTEFRPPPPATPRPESP